MSLIDWLSRVPEDERRILGQLLADLSNETLRAEYIAFLRMRDPTRSDVLGIEAELQRGAKPQAVLRARLRELLERVDSKWWSFVRLGGEIRHCGQAAGEPAPVRFKYLCPSNWDTLEPTDRAEVRYCTQCEKSVYLCNTTDDVAKRARWGQCVALDRGFAAGARAEMTASYLGRPDALQIWTDQIFGDGEV